MDPKITGGILLVIGTSIGGGMLALPIVTASSGFLTTVLMLVIIWAIMTFSAFLLLEVNLWFPPRNNMITMARQTLGKSGAMVTWITYFLLLYSLLAAYISGGTSLLNDFLNGIGIDLPAWVNSILFVVIFGSIVYSGIKLVDYANRGLMILKMGSLFAIILLALPYLTPSKLVEGNPQFILGTVTVILTSFGFANIIPSLRSYFNDDIQKLRIAILVGSLIPLLCYILWILAIVGSLPHHGNGGLLDIMQRGGSVAELTDLLKDHLKSPSITVLASVFTTICMLTAFLCVSLALSDFLADGLKMQKQGKGKIWIFTLTFLPALMIVIFYPSIFIKALSYAGIFCVILLILMPALMIISGRYFNNFSQGHYQVIGGRWAIVCLMVIAVAILVLSVWL